MYLIQHTPAVKIKLHLTKLEVVKRLSLAAFINKWKMIT